MQDGTAIVDVQSSPQQSHRTATDALTSHCMIPIDE